MTEAQRLELPSVGIDLNPIACLISRVRTAPTPMNFEQVAAGIADAARINRDPRRWDIPNVDHWFRPEVQEAIAALVQERGTSQAKGSCEALRLALSSILVRVSNQESDTRYAAIQKPVTIDLGIMDRECRVTFEAENNLDFRLGTRQLRYPGLAEKDDFAAISRVGETDYELRIYRNGSREHKALTPYAIHFIRHQGKKYSYLSNVELRRVIGARIGVA